MGIIEQLVNKGVRVVIVKEGIETSNSTYKLLLAVFGGVAEMERETIINNYQMLSKGKFKGGYSGQLITSDELFDYLKYISNL